MVLIELGLIFTGLALLHRTAHYLGFSPIPFILLAGLAFGEGGIAPLHLSRSFVQIVAEIGSLLLLFMLGLEYSGQELREALRTHFPDGLVDLLLNFLPGFLLAMGMGWGLPLALLMGGSHFHHFLGDPGPSDRRAEVGRTPGSPHRGFAVRPRRYDRGPSAPTGCRVAFPGRITCCGPPASHPALIHQRAVGRHTFRSGLQPGGGP